MASASLQYYTAVDAIRTEMDTGSVVSARTHVEEHRRDGKPRLEF